MADSAAASAAAAAAKAVRVMYGNDAVYYLLRYHAHLYDRCAARHVSFGLNLTVWSVPPVALRAHLECDAATPSDTELQQQRSQRCAQRRRSSHTMCSLVASASIQVLPWQAQHRTATV